MNAMILAAGRGERLKPVTDSLPKPLIPIHGKAVIAYHLENLAKAGFEEVVINLAYLGEKIQKTLGNGNAFGLKIIYSWEKEGGLETGGGIFNALPLLGNEPFVTINADIFTDFDFNDLKKVTLPSTCVNLNAPPILAHLILVPNPNPNVEGNFSFHQESHLISNDFPRPYLASGITLYHPDFFKDCQSGKYFVAPLWRKYADEKKISGSVFQGAWHDIGTFEKLEALNSK
jgi:MurNAc alpha-1-phosphate uridylyltransferase